MARVYITDYVEAPDFETEILQNDVSLHPSEEVEVLLVWRRIVDAEFMDNFPRLRAIIRYGVGTDNVDIKEAGRRGIVVCNTPDYGIDEVALTAISFLLYFDRALRTYDDKARRHTGGVWQQTEKRLRRSSGSAVGCIGAGRIGSSFLLKARALGFNTLFYDPYKPSGYEKILAAERSESLEQLLEESDYISIHVALTGETAGMVDEQFIGRMKAGAVLINTSRGQVFSGLDFLVQPLKSGRLGGVALDVLPQEPPQAGAFIDAWRNEADWTAGRVLINPHTAYYSQEAYREMRVKAARNALRVLNGQLPLNTVN